MSTKQIAQLVDEAISLDRQIQNDTEKLKELKADILALAESQPEAQRIETDGGGWSLHLPGSDDSIARVTRPAPKLKTVIDAEKPAGAKLVERLGKHKDRLLKPVLKYSPVPDFREQVSDLFKPAEARAIIKAATTESAPTISFETKEKA